VLLDIENIGIYYIPIAVGISLLTPIQAEIYVISYTLPVTGRHLWYITHPPWRRRVFAPVLPCLWFSKMAVPLEVRWYLIRIVRSYSDIRSVCRHFEFVWAWLIILQHLRHHKTCAWSPLPVGENRINKFHFVPEIQGVQLCTHAVYVTKIEPLFQGVNCDRRITYLNILGFQWISWLYGLIQNEADVVR